MAENEIRDAAHFLGDSLANSFRLWLNHTEEIDSLALSIDNLASEVHIMGQVIADALTRTETP
jgi:hypothetical protein